MRAHSEPDKLTWNYMGLYGPTWTYMEHFWPTWNRKGQDRTVWAHMELQPYGLTLTDMRSHGIVWTMPKWTRLGPQGTTWPITLEPNAPHETVWAHMELYGRTLNCTSPHGMIDLHRTI